MPVLQLNDKQFPLPAGPIRIGAGADADVVLPADASLGVQAVIARPEMKLVGPAIRRSTSAFFPLSLSTEKNRPSNSVTERQCRKSEFPSVVSSIPLRLRVKSATPNSSSKIRIRRVTPV